MVGHLAGVKQRVVLLGQRADRGFPLDPEHCQWLRDVALTLLNGVDDAATEGVADKQHPLAYAPGPLDRAIASVSSLPLPRL